ncbi:MAG: FMN-dependent NADH-azoreductase [Firmicutes bacterium]|nr:FMN-dependent NADH-azoreductase [Bacillota bacterium]
MANVLAIMANPRKNSHTMQIMHSFLKAYRNYNPIDTITELNLYETQIPVINTAVLEAWNKAKEQLTVEEKALVDKVDHFTSQFLEADKVVIAAPMWNLQFPPMLTAYIANITVAGKTFKYTETGWEGLVPNKPVLLIHVRGGVFSDCPAQAYDHAIPYLKSVCNLLGISDFKTIICEGIEAYPNKSKEILEQAVLEATQLAEVF